MALVEVVVEVDLVTNSKIRTTQKIQDVVKEEEIKEQGETKEEEVDGNKDKTVILMYVGFVADMVTMQMIVIKDLITED